MKCFSESAHCVMDMATKVQNLNEAVYISHDPNNLVKGMHLNILLPAMGKQ